MTLTHIAIRALRDLRLGIVSGRLVSTRLSSSGIKAPARPGLSFFVCRRYSGRGGRERYAPRERWPSGLVATATENHLRFRRNPQTC